MANLPIELVIEILARLPVKSLLRFKCVSKKWHNLITSRHFINLHLNKSVSFNNSRLLIHNQGSYLESKDLDSNFSTVTRFDFPPSSESFRAVVSGTCNGLVAVAQRFHVGDVDSFTSYEVILWNPMIDSYFVLPHAELPCVFTGDSVFGFGYDSLNDDYKIVRVTDFENEDHSLLRQIMVYSSKHNSWGVPNAEYAIDEFETSHAGALINNHIVHWIFYDDEIGKHWLRGFDLCSEKWTELPLPDIGTSKSQHHFEELQVLDGCLCLMVCANFNRDNTDNVSHVWVMKEYGVKESWTKMFSLSEIIIIGPLCAPPIAYSKNFEELLVRKEAPICPCSYVWFNMRNKNTRQVNMTMPCNVILCIGSLLPCPTKHGPMNNNYVSENIF